MDKLFTDTNWVMPVILIFGSLVPMRMFITTWHEAGHAIAIAWLTKQKAVVFLGSYGDTKNSIKITFGKYEVWLKSNPLKWKGGLCLLPRNTSLKRQLIITSAGPAASLLLSVFLLLILLLAHPNGLYIPFFIIFLAWSFLSFLGNVSGRVNAINLINGNTIMNDGIQIKNLLNTIKNPEYNDAYQLYKNKHYHESIALLEPIINNGTKNAAIYRLAISSYIKLREYSNADALQKQQISRIGNLTINDRILMAQIKCYHLSYEDGITYYKHLLQLYGNNKIILNNLGYALCFINANQEALPYLDLAIKMDDKFAFAYNNRAYAKIMLGYLEEGKLDNEKSLLLDNTNAYAWRNAGIYCFQMWRYEEAMANFEKSLELDPHTPLADQYIYETKKKLSEKRK